MTDPLDYLTIDDLSDELRDVAELVGIEAVRKMMRELSGVEVRIPSLIYYVDVCDRYIAAHYPAVTVRKIARRLRCSTEFVYSRLRQLRTNQEGT